MPIEPDNHSRLNDLAYRTPASRTCPSVLLIARDHRWIDLETHVELPTHLFAALGQGVVWRGCMAVPRKKSVPFLS